MARPTRSPRPVAELSPEVRWYLRERGYKLPRWCVPAVRTPEPRDVPAAVFDPARVDRVIAALRMLRHVQGRWAGRPLDPDAWQVAYVIAPVFGWVAPDPESGELVRIIRNVFVDVPRKNGKTTLATGLAMVLAFADGEPGAQVVAAAASKDQARNAFDPARTITEGSPQLRKAGVKALAARIERRVDGSFFKVVSALADLLHGANIHGAVVDELHVHKDDQVLKAIESGTGARLQPLVVIITTTDEGKPNTVYDQTRKYIERLAQRTVANPRQYGVIFAAREGDPPGSETTWRRANPGYGVSPTKAFLEDEARKAQQNPSNMASFERLHLGLRSRRRVQYLPLPLWDRNAGLVREERLVGRPCYIGLDLSATTDLTAACLLFPPPPDDPGAGYDAVWRFWAPEDRLLDLAKRTSGAAEHWHRRGYLRLTPGNVVDYDRVEHQLDDDLTRFDVLELPYDPWNATDLTNRMTGKGAPMAQVRQGYSSMSPPLKELLRLLTAGTEKTPLLRHGGNPVMRWMVDNLAVARDAADNVKPDKASSAEKIDGVSALVTAMARAMHYQGPGRSLYDDADVEFG